MIEGPPLPPTRPEFEPPRRLAVGTRRVVPLPASRLPVDLSVDSVALLREFERTGRPDVFEAFMRRHASMVYATCLKVTRDPHDAEDATQATFLTLASKAHLSADIRQPEAWLRKVAHRLALDLIRSKKRRVNRENLRSEMTSEETPLDSHDHADAGEVKGILNEELQKLPASYRMPLILHYFGGLSRDEMAAQLKLKPSTLGVRLHRAREQLRKRLATRGVALPAVAVTALLTDAVRSSICSQMIPAVATKASAIALGHAAAPPAYSISASAGTLGFGSIRSILAVMAASKLKFSIAALVLATAISMTSAQVRSFIPEIIRSIVPSLHMPGLPKIQFTAPIPRLTASNVPAPLTEAATADAMPYAVQPVVIPGHANVALPAHKAAAADVVVAPARSLAVATPSNAAWTVEPIAPRTNALDRAVAATNAPRAVGSTRTLAPAADTFGSGSATAATLARPTQSATASRDANASDVSVPASFAQGVSAVGTVLPPSGFGAIGENIQLPTSLAAATGNQETPAHAGASVTGDVPSLAKDTTKSAEDAAATHVSSSSVAASSVASAGDSGTSGSASHSVASATHASGNSSSSLSSAPSQSFGQLNSTPTQTGVPHEVALTSVFTGIASNYGGYTDAQWTPTEAQDLTHVIQSTPTAASVAAGFDTAVPTIPGETLSVNGARVIVHTKTTGSASDLATPTIEFVDTNDANIPAFPSPHVFFGVWKLDSNTPIDSADLLVRYDDLRAARLGLHEQFFKLWVSDGTSWQLLWKDPTFGRDADKNLLWVTAQGDFKYFAVSSPEPATLASVLSVIGMLSARRRRK